MSDSVWYYAHDDVEHGPLTSLQIKALARVGKLLPDDLVWKEGMEDWRPASEIRGLLPVKEPEMVKFEDRTRAEEPPPPPVAPVAPEPPPEPRPEPPRAEPPASEPPRSPPQPLAPRTVATSGVVDASAHAQLGLSEGTVGFLLTIGRGLVAVGLLMALLSRGCDTLGDRNVERLRAQATMLENLAAEATGKEKPDDKAVAAAKRSARDAAANNAAWGFWRYVGFLLGAVCVVWGAAVLLPTTDGPERWLSLVLIAILAFGLFGRL